MKAPVRYSGPAESRNYFYPPDREWLEYQGIVLWKSQRQIAREIGCAKRTVCTWCKELGVHKPMSEKQIKYKRLDRAWLEQKYLRERLWPKEIAAIVGCGTALVYHQLRKYGLAQSRQVVCKRLMDENSTNWRGGVSQQYQKAQLLRAGKELRCEWCGDEGGTRHIHVHHIDHNRKNHDPSNLMLLCYNCNLMEANMWALQKKGLATFTVEPGERIEVRFNKQSLRVSA